MPWYQLVHNILWTIAVVVMFAIIVDWIYMAIDLSPYFYTSDNLCRLLLGIVVICAGIFLLNIIWFNE